MRTALLHKLRQTYPLALDVWLEDQADRLAAITPELQPNLAEWLRGEPFTDIRIHGIYSLQGVLNLHRSGDICNVLLALDAYAKDRTKESGLYLWEV